jgi:4-amino-4-deoxy-L-arabinose transferase-like glycosyltransferase
LTFLTAGTSIQFGRAGETDMLFTFLMMSAFAAFELGRRRDSPATQWVGSQALLAFAVLAKGIAPIFFYPPVLFLAWRRRRQFPFSARAFALGALVLVLIVAAWVIPYALESSLTDLTRQAGAEISDRTPLRRSALRANRVPLYPIMLLLAAAPWSLVFPALIARRVRRAVGGLLGEPYLALAAAVAGWGVLALAVVPGAKPRYVLPIMPCAAVLAAYILARPRAARITAAGQETPSSLARSRAWFALAFVFTAVVLIAGLVNLVAAPRAEQLLLIISTTVIGLLVVLAGFQVSRHWNPLATWVLVLGLLYGVAFTGIWERRDAEKRLPVVRAAQVLAAAVPDQKIPLVCSPQFDRQIAYALVRRLGRPLDSTAPPGAHVLFARDADGSPPAARRLAAAGGITAYLIPDERGPAR